ncbi:MAG TPA: spore coat protein U domain-containing protein [Anaeromyxobacteraceae bacterium]
MRRLVLAVVAAALVPGAARAGTATATFNVNATVTKNCTITGPGSVTFPSWDMTGPTDVTGKLTVACTKGASYSMTLASDNAWTMKGTSDALAYVIFQPKADGSADTSIQWNTTSYSYSPTSRTAKDLIFTARVQPQDVAAGAYTDTVTATINF